MKNILLTIGLVFFCLAVYGQESMVVDSTRTNTRGKFRIGPTLGIGTSFMHDANQTKRKEHVHLGILGNYKINKMLNFQQVICLSTKGYGGGSNGNGYSYDAEKVNLTYIDALFTLKFQPWKMIFIGAGTHVGYLVSAGYEYEIDPYHQEQESVGIKKITNDWDYGLNGSIGCQFKSGIGIEFTVVYGLNSVFNKNSNESIYYDFNNNPGYIPEDAKGKNTLFAMSFYALFGKKHKK